MEEKRPKRALKNVIMIILMAVLAGSMVFTMKYIQKANQAQMPTITNQQGSSSSDSSDSSSSSGSSSDSNSQNSVPAAPDGQQPGGSGDSSNNSSSDSSSSDNSGKSSSDNSGSGSDTNQPPSMNGGGQMQPDNGNMGKGMGGGFSKKYIAIFGAESFAFSLIFLYMLMSHANKKTRKETFKNGDKILIYILAMIILTTAITTGDTLFMQKMTMSTQMGTPGGSQSQGGA